MQCSTTDIWGFTAQAKARLLSLLNGGTLPSDASLLSMSTNHLNRDLGLSFDTIPSLRLHLR